MPEQARRQALRAYTLFSRDPFYNSLQFKQVHSTKPLYSVRINDGMRALGLRDGDEIVWFWIGSHREYESLLRRL
jgi:hypothetical protein